MGACCSKLLALFQGSSRDRSGYNSIPDDSDNEAKERLLKEKKPSSHLEQVPHINSTNKPPKAQVPMATTAATTSSQSQVTIFVFEVITTTDVSNIVTISLFLYRQLK